MWKIVFSFIFFLTVFTGRSLAQDTLPSITVKNFSGKIIISWKNNYKIKINNINIQRSFDSLKNFSTIGSVLNPMNADNGFADKPPYSKMFYRVFVSFEGGTYIFSKSFKPVKDTTATSIQQTQGTDTTVIQEAKVIAPTGFVPSKNVYTGKDNNVIIYLPHAVTKKYTLKFFDEDDNPVFEINKITETYLILDKVNFMHSGWFQYHLYENGVLLEKYKFYIPKDGKTAPANYEQGKRNKP